VHLSAGRLTVWVVAAVAIGVGAFLVGHAGAKGAKAASLQSAEGPHGVTVPKLTGVAPLPSMKAPPKPEHKQPADTATAGEEPSSEGETGSEYETYVPPEETGSTGEESSGSSGGGAESTPAPKAEVEPTHETTKPESSSGGGGGELEPQT
jgi:hypothetical protein